MVWSILLTLPAAAQEAKGSPEASDGQAAEPSHPSRESGTEAGADGEDQDWYIAILGMFSRNGLRLGPEDFLDVAMIVKIDRETHKVSTRSVSVDKGMVSAGMGNERSLGDIYAQDGYEAALKVLSLDQGITFDDYLVFNWKAIADEINILDGVEITLSEEELYYINAYVTETVAETGVASTMVKSAGKRYFDGVQLVAYSRLSQLEGGMTREERQQKVLSMAWKKAMEADGISMYEVLQCMLPQVDTSLDSEDMEWLYSMGRAA